MAGDSNQVGFSNKMITLYKDKTANRKETVHQHAFLALIWHKIAVNIPNTSVSTLCYQYTSLIASSTLPGIPGYSAC